MASQMKPNAYTSAVGIQEATCKLSELVPGSPVTACLPGMLCSPTRTQSCPCKNASSSTERSLRSFLLVLSALVLTSLLLHHPRISGLIEKKPVHSVYTRGTRNKTEDDDISGCLRWVGLYASTTRKLLGSASGTSNLHALLQLLPAALVGPRPEPCPCCCSLASTDTPRWKPRDGPFLPAHASSAALTNKQKAPPRFLQTECHADRHRHPPRKLFVS